MWGVWRASADSLSSVLQIAVAGRRKFSVGSSYFRYLPPTEKALERQVEYDLVGLEGARSPRPCGLSGACLRTLTAHSYLLGLMGC